MAGGSSDGAASNQSAALWQDDPLIGRVLDRRYRIDADHIEAGSFIGLAAVTGSEITIEDAPVERVLAAHSHFEFRNRFGDAVVQVVEQFLGYFHAYLRHRYSPETTPGI
jgi:hypothetical protein